MQMRLRERMPVGGVVCIELSPICQPCKILVAASSGSSCCLVPCDSGPPAYLHKSSLRCLPIRPTTALYNSVENARRLSLAYLPVGYLVATKSLDLLGFSQ
jgi:hypothetical protein